MKKIISAAATITVLFYLTCSSVSVNADTCSPTITNCLPDTIELCTYDGSSLWDTLYAYNSGGIDSEDSLSDTPMCGGVSECYITGAVDNNYDCVLVQFSGFVGCSDYACVDDSDGYQWYSGDSGYCCSDNTCTTSC